MCGRLQPFRPAKENDRKSQMIELTEKQRNAIRDGLPVRVAEDGNQYVLLRADVYERLAEGGYDDSPWTAAEMDQLRADSLAAIDRYGKGS